MKDLWAVVWDIYLYFVLFEFLVDLCLHSRGVRSVTDRTAKEGKLGTKQIKRVILPPPASHIHPSSNLQAVGPLPPWHPGSNHHPQGLTVLLGSEPGRAFVWSGRGGGHGDVGCKEPACLIRSLDNLESCFGYSISEREANSNQGGR